MSKSVIQLLAKDLNNQGGVFCPSPLADMKLWNSHPKVYLDVAHSCLLYTSDAADERIV